VDEYLCLTVLSHADEPASEFSSRLSRFWTRMLRERPDEFEQVYAETTTFEPRAGNVLGRQYLIRPEVAGMLETELRGAGIAFEPIDRDETYSKYEATPPDWMQIEH
jgi:hypothetical protein